MSASINQIFYSSARALFSSSAGRPSCRLLHTTGCVSGQQSGKRSGKPGKRNSSQPSRTRLAKDIQPTFSDSPPSNRRRRSRSGLRNEPEPPREAFRRDSLPHDNKPAVDDSENGSSGAFRRYKNPGIRGGVGTGDGLLGRAHRSTIFDRTTVKPSATSPRFNGSASSSSSPSNRVTEDGDQAEFGAWRVESGLDEYVHHGRVTHTSFSSPPLLTGLATSLRSLLGDGAKPTPIQSLSMQNILPSLDQGKTTQYLLAAETGSGKSIAYLLPVIQSLRQSEAAPEDRNTAPRAIAPRAIILAPTHELARQLAQSASSLTHVEKLRVQCTSRANTRTRELDEARDVDILVGTPMKILEMLKGRGWDRFHQETEDQSVDDKTYRKGRDATLDAPSLNDGKLRLENVQWVVVDEADVLFDPDFISTTKLLLSSITSARPAPAGEGESNFNLILSTATIPTALSSYLSKHHPNLTRLASPGVHKLPSTLRTEFVPWQDGGAGSRNRTIERRIRQIWEKEWQQAAANTPRGAKPAPEFSKVLVFGNKNTRVQALSEYLDGKGIKTVALSGIAEARTKERGSNRHLKGFLRVRERGSGKAAIAVADAAAEQEQEQQEQEQQEQEQTLSSREEEKDADSSLSPLDPSSAPHVLITTSLLSRGLDFAPEVRYVFVVDEPRNMVDFLHRAGRSGRAGVKGTVVVFGAEGKGAEVKRRLAEVVTASRKVASRSVKDRVIDKRDLRGRSSSSSSSSYGSRGVTRSGAEGRGKLPF